jgi:hypothetical protein
MKKLLFVITLLAILFTNTLSSQCKFDITQEKIDGYVLLRLKHQDSLKIKSVGWSNGKSEKEIILKENGIFCVKIQFTNGCISDGCIEVNSFKPDTTCKIEIVKISDNSGKLKFCVRGADIKKIQWSSGETSECIYPNKSGEYCVKIVNQKGCETKACLIYTASADDTCSVKILNIPGINGIHKPTLCLLPAGNVKYFEWSTGSTDRCITPEKNGEYCVKVQYVNGCTAKECIKTDINTGACTAEIFRKKDASSGQTYLCVTSKSALKQISWSTGDSSDCIIPAKSGDYCATVLTKEGCETKVCIKYEVLSAEDSCKVHIVRAPGTVNANQNNLCVLTTGEIKSVEWSTGSKDRCITPVQQGEYCVTVLYLNGCKAKSCVKIEDSSKSCKIEIIKRADQNTTFLCVISDKEIKQIKWNSGDTTRCIKPLKSGEYCVTIVTTDGCESKKCMAYNQDPGTNPNICSISVKREKRGNSLYLCADTGSSRSDSSIVWSNGSKGKCIEIKEKGRYCAQIIVDGCEARACVTIDSLTMIGFSENDDNTKSAVKSDKTESNKIIKISGYGPNPSTNYIFVDIKAEITHSAKLMLFDMNGNNISTQNIYLVSGENTTEIDISQLRTGIYQLKLVNSSDMESVKIVKAF